MEPVPEQGCGTNERATSRVQLAGLVSYPARYLHGDCIAIDTRRGGWPNRSRVPRRDGRHYAISAQRDKGIFSLSAVATRLPPTSMRHLPSGSSPSPAPNFTIASISAASRACHRPSARPWPGSTHSSSRCRCSASSFARRLGRLSVLDGPAGRWASTSSSWRSSAANRPRLRHSPGCSGGGAWLDCAVRAVAPSSLMAPRSRCAATRRAP